MLPEYDFTGGVRGKHYEALREGYKAACCGPHDIRIDYFQRGGIKALEIWWPPPGEQLRPVPPGVLSP